MRLPTALAACVLLCAASAPAQEMARTQDPPPLVAVRAGERPVELHAASVDVQAGAGLVRTTLELAFANPNARVLEGNLQFPLRPGQQVVGFALDIDGRMREAVPVEKARGRQVFEAIERRGADPALLEQAAGDVFRLRIYPFPAGGTRRVRLVLVEPVRVADGAAGVALPLRFARGLGEVPVTVHAPTAPQLRGLLRPAAARATGAGTYVLPLRGGDLPPRGEPVLVLPVPAGPAVQVQRRGGDAYFVAEVPVEGASAPRRLPAKVGLLWDASASGAARAHDLEFALLDAYFRAAGDIAVDLVALRDVAAPVQRFAVHGGDWSALRRALQATVYDGATSTTGWRPDPSVGDYLLFGDGLFNYGDAPFPALAPAQRLYAIRAGVAGDSTRLQALALARHGRAIELDDASGLDAAQQALLRDGPRLESIDGIGIEDALAESPFAQDGVLRVAGRLREADARLRLRLATPAGPRGIEVPLRDAPAGDLPAWTWARYRLAQLQADPRRNRAAIARLGTDFGLVTPRSSLIVLERATDYLQYDIAPPAELADEVRALAREAADAKRAGAARQMESVKAQWQARIDWWSRAFPKDAPPKPKPDPREAALRARMQAQDARGVAEAAPAATAAPTPPPPAPPAPPAQAAQTLDRVAVTGSRIGDAAAPGEAARIALQPWRPDSPFARRLRLAAPDEAYALYLDERANAPAGTAFYLDVADVLLEKKRTALALRVLSNLAEMDLDNRHVLRVLGYRLLQAGRADLTIPVLSQVLEMADDEPQSYRDLALAHAVAGDRQRAVALLYEVVTGRWDGRFPGIEVIALAELNALVATAPTPLDTSGVDPELLRSLPLGLRTVLSWDSDNSDMDLWVTDPNGEKAYYGNRLTRQGGAMSPDFTGGYGPEEFALRAPRPGTYRVEANFFGDRQQVVTGATTLQLWLSTGFGTPRQHDERVTLRLRDARETVFVGEFEVR